MIVTLYINNTKNRFFNDVIVLQNHVNSLLMKIRALECTTIQTIYITRDNNINEDV